MSDLPHVRGPGTVTAATASRDAVLAPPAALGAAAVAVFAWWAIDEGGAAPSAWYPGALAFLVGLLVVARPGALRRLAPPARWALLALAAFTAWSFLSIAWAQVPGDAWDGANRTLLYLTVFALFAAVAWSPSQAIAFLGALVAAAVGCGLWTLATAIAGTDPDAVVDGRLAGPVGYENASAALLLAAFWPAVLLAARPAAPRWQRGLLLAAAGVLLELAILTQSRASVIAGCAAVALALWLTRERARLAIALAAVGLVAGAALPVLLAVYADEAGRPHGALVRAAVAIGASAVVLLAAGAASVRLDRRARDHPRAPLALGWRLAIGAAVVATVAGSVLFARSALLSDGASAGVATRFAPGVDYGRYDLWRVAAAQLGDRPLHGAGADNFAHAYARDRRHRDELLYPHSVEWRTLGQLGLVGGALLATFLAGVLAAGRRLAGDRARAPAAVAAIVAAGYWLAHATFDWLWELPAVTAPAMACLGLVAGLTCAPPHAGGTPSGRPRAPSRGRRLAAYVLAGALTGAAALSLALPGLAALRVERAVALWDEDRAAAARELDAARRLNPLSDRADVVAGALALSAGERAVARRAFERAVQRDPHSWHSQTQLAVLEIAGGQRAAALARLRLAHELNPLEPAIGVALEAARRGAPIPPAVDRRLQATAIPGPLGPRPVSCRPVLGLAAQCTREVRG